MLARRAFTLIEVLVAIVLVELGLLTSVAAAAVMFRTANEGRLATIAANRAASRLEVLRESPCQAASGVTAGPFRESWTATAQHNGVRNLSDSVEYRASGRLKSVVLRTRDLC